MVTDYQITDANELKVGQWVAYCCELDLRQIESEDEIAEIIEDWDDDDGLVPRVWTTKESALAELKSNETI